MEQLSQYPTLVTRGLFIFPDQTHVIEVGRPKSLKAIKLAKTDYNGFIICLAQKDPLTDDPTEKDIFPVGTLCQIKVVVKINGALSTTLKGIKRVKIKKMTLTTDSWFVEQTDVKDVKGPKATELAYVRKTVKILEEIAPEQSMPVELINTLSINIESLELINSIANYLPMPVDKKAAIMAESSINKRLQMLLKAVEFEKAVSSMETKISDDVKDSINNNQKEYYLRERIRSIQGELGEMENGVSDIDLFKNKLKEMKAPANIKEKIADEIKKLERTPPSSAEHGVIRTYLEVMISVPWSGETKDVISLSKIKKSLNEKHFGLEKIKERILEYIAVKENTKTLNSPILCLVGPPGVGKTSLAYSIAEGLGRNFVKVSLGGVKDESEIRGHRKTYLGSMPGRIIKGMIKAKVVNPVFLLDELDKMASDYKGDPSSAMLEVLDPEQNKEFSDHYVEENYDLSKVMFIATANYMYDIPSALRDRLEIIQLSSYTEQEKVKIAIRYLVPKSLEKHGLKLAQLRLSENSILYLIRHYTREAGVRDLERTLDKISRKKVMEIMSKKSKSNIATKTTILKYLGKERFEHSLKEKKPQVGVVTGLAYTQFGGDILPVEVTYFKGKGKIIVTGSLGDVMKESAHIAISYVKTNAKKFGIDSKIFETNDIHIHFPEGATPKDGPSAGITMCTAIFSALTNKPVGRDIAMTGEVNLRGHVLPIGGLREKSISAHRSGIKTILIPSNNIKDLDEIPKEVKKDLKIIPVKTMNDVLKEVFK